MTLVLDCIVCLGVPVVIEHTYVVHTILCIHISLDFVFISYLYIYTICIMLPNETTCAAFKNLKK